MGNWPSDYVATTITSGFGGKVVSNNWNEGGFGVTDSVMISGHRTVATKEDLNSIPTQILSSKASNKAPNNDGTDALGQLWYVEDEKCFYQLIQWNLDKRKMVWAKANIKSMSQVNPDGSVTDVIESAQAKDGEWLTYVSVNGEGKMDMKSDGLHLTNTTNAKSYSSSSKNQIFNVIDSIDVNGHTISYNKTEITVLSQSHHGGSKNANPTGFITSVSLSNEGKLTAGSANIVIQENKKDDLSYSSSESTYTFKIIDGVSLKNHTIAYDSRNITVLSQSHHSGSEKADATGFITSVELSNEGTLTATKDNIVIEEEKKDDLSYSSTDSVNSFKVIDGISLEGHKISYTSREITTLSQSHHSGSVEGDFLTSVSLSNTGTLSGAYGTFKNSSVSYGIIDTEDISPSYSYIVTDVHIDKDGHLEYSYVSPRNWIHGPIRYILDSDKDLFNFNYKSNGRDLKLYMPIASYSYGDYKVTSYTLGLMSSYMDRYFSAVINDLQDRLLGKETNYTLPTLSITGTKFTVYNADGISNPKSYTGNAITVEVGDYVAVEGSECSFTPGTGQLVSTSGTWGNVIPTESTKFNGTKSVAKAQYLGTKEFFSQSMTAINWEGAKSFQITGTGTKAKLIRKDADNTTGSVSANVKINVVYRANMWYGAVAFNPATWAPNSTHKETEIVNANGTAIYNTVSTTIKRTIAMTTTAANPYYVYIYKQGTGTLSEAKSPGADATAWFNTKSPIPIKIKSKTNGYVTNYYMIYALNYNTFKTTTNITFN